MDDFENSFFDQILSSPSHPLCSASANSIAVSSHSSNIANGCNTNPNSLLPDQDLGAMLLSSPENPNHDLSDLLEDFANDSAAIGNSEPLNIDSIIEPDKSVDVGNVSNSKVRSLSLEQCKTKTHTSTSEKLFATSNSIVQVKLMKPVGLSTVVPTFNSSGLIPVTVHSVLGQKHSVIRTTLPICGPRVHLLPAGNHSIISHPNTLQQPLGTIEKPKISLTDSSHLRIMVCNVVASFRVRCHLNLRQIALESIDVIYRKEAQKVVMRMRKPKCTAYMWSSGKIVCTGSTSEESAKKAAKKFCRRLLKLGFKIRFADFKIVNVLAVSKMPYAINIQDFSQTHKGKHCSYEPELHPGVTFRDANSRATLKIFSTGSVTVTGRSVSRATEAVRNVYPLFKDFYKLDKPNQTVQIEEVSPSDEEDFS